VLILAAIAVAVWLSRNQNAARVPAEATAQVAAAQSSVFETPSDSADEVVALKKGDTVNVIRPPRSRSQEWTEVQFVTAKKVYPVGAMHTADLGSWSSPKPDVALYLLQLYAPADGASEAELRAYAQKLKDFIQHFSATPQKAAALVELDKTNAALAQLGAPAPPDSRKPAAAPPSPKPPAAPFDAEAALARAEQSWENGEYLLAESQLKRILQQRPNFPAARQLLEKVQRARQLENAR
jgi:hypothetical protein